MAKNQIQIGIDSSSVKTDLTRFKNIFTKEINDLQKTISKLRTSISSGGRILDTKEAKELKDLVEQVKRLSGLDTSKLSNTGIMAANEKLKAVKEEYQYNDKILKTKEKIIREIEKETKLNQGLFNYKRMPLGASLIDAAIKEAPKGIL